MLHRSLSKAAAAVGTAAVAALLLAGCSTGGGASSTTLTVQVQAGSEKEFDGFIKVFEAANPGIKVKTTSVAQTAKTGTNLQVITSNNAPDVAIVPTNTQVYTELTAGKGLEDLSDVWTSSDLVKRYGDVLAGALKTDGKPYVVSYDSTLYDIVYYNKDLFSSLGIPEPKNNRFDSIAQLKSAVDTLKAAGKQGLGIGPADNYQSSWMMDAFLPTSASPDDLNNYLSSWQLSTPVTAKYTDKGFVDAITQIQDMGKAGVFQDGYLGQTVAQAEALWFQGEVGLMLDGSYSAQVFKDNGISFNYGWALLPPVDSSRSSQITVYNGNTLAIPVKAKNKDLAKKFLESVMSIDGQSTVTSIGSLPAVNDVPTEAYSSFLPPVLEQIADIKANGSQPGWTSTVPGGLGQQLIDPLLQELLNGNGTAKDVAQKVQDELDKIRSAK